MDHMVIVGTVQHVLWDRLPGPSAKLQQPGAPPRGPHLRWQEPGGAVSELCLQGGGDLDILAPGFRISNDNTSP